jgi:hypothetical protein
MDMKALNSNLSNMTLRRVLALGALVALVGLGTHPTFQWLVHTFLIHALALDPTSWLLSALGLTLSGWSVELSFRATPWLGALPFANLTVGLIFLGIRKKFPPFTYAAHLLQFIGAYGIHLLGYLLLNWQLNHVWAWDYMYLVIFLTTPLLAGLSWQLLKFEKHRKS